MRVPLFIGIDSSISAKSVLEDIDVEIRPSTAGGWELIKNNYEALVFLLGTKSVGGTNYKVYLIMVYKGDQRNVYRFLKNKVDLIGPYTLSNAPAQLLTFLGELDGSGVPKSPIVIAGESLDIVDVLNYTEGASEDGSDDIVE